MTKFDEFGLPEPTKYPQMPKVIKMNERIKELAEQAGFGIAGDPEYIHAMDYDGICTDELKKFAELIVRECAQVAFEGDLKRAIGQWGSHSDILIHFGIEHDVVKKFRGEE
jgi:hypothetical protein